MTSFIALLPPRAGQGPTRRSHAAASYAWYCSATRPGEHGPPAKGNGHPTSPVLLREYLQDGWPQESAQEIPGAGQDRQSASPAPSADRLTAMARAAEEHPH